MSINKELNVTTRGGVICLDDKPVNLYCELITKNESIMFTLTSPNSRLLEPQTKFNKLLKLGSSLRVYTSSRFTEKTPIIFFERNLRGKFTVTHKETEKQCVISTNDVFKEYPVLMQLIFGREVMLKHTSVENNTVSTTVKRKPVENNVITQGTKLKGPFYNGKAMIRHIDFDVKNNKPRINVFDDNKGSLPMTNMTFSYKKGSREQNKVVSMTLFKPQEWLQLFDRLVKGEINVLETYYWSNKLRFRMNLFTIEYINHHLLFTYTLKDVNKNYTTVRFLDVTEDGFSIVDDNYPLDVIASLFGHTKETFKPYLMILVKQMNQMNKISKKECLPVYSEYHQWAKTKGFVLDYLPQYNETDLLNTMKKVHNGYNQLENHVDTSKYNPLYKIAFTKTSNLGIYYYHSSKLEFSINYDSFDESTVYHEYGHLIYYSLLSKQLVGEEQANQNNTLIKEFLANYKNCSYIEVLKEKQSSKLSYYRQDTELFARLFETYMMLKTDKKLYKEKMEKDDTMNNELETLLFIGFMNKHFSTNFSL